jgi:hypothetical protein
MRAGRVTNGDNALPIQLVITRERADEVSAAGNVTKRARPASTVIAKAPILDVPGGDARVGQRSGERTHVVHRDRPLVIGSQFREPAPAVNHDCDRISSFRRGQAQLAELQRRVSVGDTVGARWNRGVGQVERTSVLRRDRAGEQRNSQQVVDSHDPPVSRSRSRIMSPHGSWNG